MPRNRENNTAPARVKALVRRQRALEMRIAGATLAAISDDVGMTKQGCSKTLQVALAQLAKDNAAAADKLRALTCARFDTMILALWEKALDGDVAAAGEIRRIEETRHRILGTMLDPKFTFEANINVTDRTSLVETARAKLDKVIEAKFDEVKAPEGE